MGGDVTVVIVAGHPEPVLDGSSLVHARLIDAVTVPHRHDVAVRGPRSWRRPTDLHDRAQRRFLGHGLGAERHVVGLAVHAIDDQRHLLPEFVGQPLADHLADDGLGREIAADHVVAGRPLAPALGERPVHGVQDVVAVGERFQPGLEVAGEGPDARLLLPGEVVALQHLQPADDERQVLVRLSRTSPEPHVHHMGVRRHLD